MCGHEGDKATGMIGRLLAKAVGKVVSMQIAVPAVRMMTLEFRVVCFHTARGGLGQIGASNASSH